MRLPFGVDNAQYFFFYLQAARSNILSEPTITSKIKDFGIENGQLELECAVKVASMANRLEMKWELPNDNIAEKVWKFMR